MEIKAKLLKPITTGERFDFIIKYNHELGYEIRDTEEEIQAWGKTKEEKAQEEAQRIALLSLTRGDVFRAILKYKGITKAEIKSYIEAMPISTDEEKLKKELALIDFEDALNFYRGNPLIDTIGTALGCTKEELDYLFEHGEFENAV